MRVRFAATRATTRVLGWSETNAPDWRATAGAAKIRIMALKISKNTALTRLVTAAHPARRSPLAHVAVVQISRAFAAEMMSGCPLCGQT
jgi:hypothetical protein